MLNVSDNINWRQSGGIMRDRSNESKQVTTIMKSMWDKKQRKGETEKAMENFLGKHIQSVAINQKPATIQSARNQFCSKLAKR